jgi:hypothetical protein
VLLRWRHKANQSAIAVSCGYPRKARQLRRREKRLLLFSFLDKMDWFKANTLGYPLNNFFSS